MSQNVCFLIVNLKKKLPIVYDNMFVSAQKSP